MQVYLSPVYPAIQVRLGNKRIRATAGVINVKDEDIEEFELWASKRPHYKISDEDGNAVSREPARRERKAKAETLPKRAFVAPGITESERHPELVSEQTVDSLSVPELREALRAKDLPISGNREILIDRLTKADEEDEQADADAAIEEADRTADIALADDIDYK